jgi:cystathionine gamma-synthase
MPAGTLSRAARQDVNVPSTSTIVENAIARSSLSNQGSDPCGRLSSAPRFPWMASCKRPAGRPTFQRSPDGSFPSGYEYIRDGNPNRQALEVAMAKLEDGASAVAFASGMAATMAVFQTLAPGDHVIAPLDAYFGTSKLLREHFSSWGLEVSFVDTTNLSTVQAALRPTTRLIWTETPSNPTIAVTDLKGVSAIAKSAGALTACDNTWATPFLQRPLALGVDLVMHSTTKYLSGHCDVMGGVIVAREAGPVVERLRAVQVHGGAVPSPFDSWLVLRGIRTLPWRMRAHCSNAAAVATFLSEHPQVKQVHYPGLRSDPAISLPRRRWRRPVACSRSLCREAGLRPSR